MMVVLCLIVFMGLAVARLIAGRPWQSVRLITILAACGLAADGWTTIRTAELPQLAAGGLQGTTVLFLPAGQVYPDIAAVYRAVAQEFRSINGYSGYEPPYYEALRTLSDDADERLFDPFVARSEVHVVVPRDATPVRELVERQPGSRLVSAGAAVHYVVPQRSVPPVRTAPRGTRVPIDGLTSACSPERAPSIIDGTVQSIWMCTGTAPDQRVTLDLGRPSTVGEIVHSLGRSAAFFPRHLIVETSLDGQAWTPGWEGSPAAAALRTAMATPLDARLLIEFPARQARYVRLRQTIRGSDYIWAIAELEIWSGEQEAGFAAE
jgi:hypothetical protein